MLIVWAPVVLGSSCSWVPLYVAGEPCLLTLCPTGFDRGGDSDVGAVQSIPVGAEIEGIGADDLEELSEDENEYYKLGAEDEEFKDYKTLGLKLDHANR